MRVYTTVYRRLDLVAFEMADRLPPLPGEPPLTFQPLDPDTLPLYRQLRPAQAAPARARYDRGERCVIALHGGAPVSAGWICGGNASLPYLGAHIPLAPAECYLHDTFTAASYRGQGVARRLYADIIGRLNDAGWSRCLAAVAPENHAGVAVFASLGWRVLGRYHYLRAGLWRGRWSEPRDGETLPLLFPGELGVRGAVVSPW